VDAILRRLAKAKAKVWDTTVCWCSTDIELFFLHCWRMYGTRIFLNRLAMFSCSHCTFSSSDNSYKVTVLLRKIMLNMAANLLNYFLFYSTFTIKTLRCHLHAESNVAEMCTVHSQTSTIKNIEHYKTEAAAICSLPQKAPKYIIHQW
jgi:hypothetical protein